MSAGAAEVLFQYGAIGAILVLAIAFMWYMHRQTNRRADTQIVACTEEALRERTRADRLENALALQNTIIHEKVIPLAASLAQTAQVFTTMTDRVVAGMEERESA